MHQIDVSNRCRMIYSIGTVCLILGFTLEGMRRASQLIRRRKELLECLRLCKWMEREVTDRRNILIIES